MQNTARKPLLATRQSHLISLTRLSPKLGRLERARTWQTKTLTNQPRQTKTFTSQPQHRKFHLRPCPSNLQPESHQ